MRHLLLGLAFALMSVPAVTFAAPKPAPLPQAAYERYGQVERFRIASKHTGRSYTIEIYKPAG